MASRLTWLVVVCALGGGVGCNSELGFAVELTIHQPAKITPTELLAITSYTIEASGDEVFKATVNLTTLGRSAEETERVVYRPDPSTRNLTLTATEYVDTDSFAMGDTAPLKLSAGQTLSSSIQLETNATSDAGVDASQDGAPEVVDAGDGGSATPHFAVEMIDDEALGPFASWGNAMTKYGAKGDGTTDDTAALQNGLHDISTGAMQVLYLPAGTYKITSTLELTGSLKSGAGSFGPGGVGMIGADPATTTIKWFGPSGDAMLLKNGGLGTRFHRITWDGSSSAGYGITEWYVYTSTIVPGGSSEHLDEVFENMGIGIMAGRRGTGYGQYDDAGVIRRVTFVNDTNAGFDTGAYSAMHWWIWESQFINCGAGVSNVYGVDDSGPNTNGAGSMSVYRSLFKGSKVADVSEGNTGVISLHENVSIGSAKLITTAGEGNNPSPMIVEGNRIVMATTDPPIAYGDDGALMLVDNQIVAQTATFANVNFVTDTDVLALGNMLTAPLPTPTGTERTLDVDNVMVAASQISTAPPALPATPPVTTHSSLAEVPSGASAAQIQALITAAQQTADPLPIIHFGTGTWSIASTLTVPAGGRVQLVGDGSQSTLNWTGATGSMLAVTGPAHVTVRDMQWTGSALAVSVNKADQAGGRIEIIDSTNGPISAQHITQTQLELQNNAEVASVALDAARDVVSIGAAQLGGITTTGESTLIASDSSLVEPGGNQSFFQIADGTFTYLAGTVSISSAQSVPPILVDNSTAMSAWVGVVIDTTNLPQNIAAEVENEQPSTQAYFFGSCTFHTNQPQWFSRLGTGGEVSFNLNRAGPSQYANQGDTSADAVRSAWAQARALVWDTAPRTVPSSAINLRVQHVKMDQTLGIAISGQ